MNIAQVQNKLSWNKKNVRSQRIPGFSLLIVRRNPSIRWGRYPFFLFYEQIMIISVDTRLVFLIFLDGYIARHISFEAPSAILSYQSNNLSSIISTSRLKFKESTWYGTVFPFIGRKYFVCKRFFIHWLKIFTVSFLMNFITICGGYGHGVSCF